MLLSFLFILFFMVDIIAVFSFDINFVVVVVIIVVVVVLAIRMHDLPVTTLQNEKKKLDFSGVLVQLRKSSFFFLRRQ